MQKPKIFCIDTNRYQWDMGACESLEWPIASESSSRASKATRTTETSRSFTPTSASATTSVTIAKEVQTIADVQHSIAVDGVNLTVAPAVGIDSS